MLTICTWLWGSAYALSDVEKLLNGLSRHIEQDFYFHCVTDDLAKVSALVGKKQRPGVAVGISNDIWDIELTKIKGCFARLRMFDPEWQGTIPLSEGDRLVCVDLDVVITGPLDTLFNRPENFCILLGANASNPCRVNGSLMMLRAGAHPEVWSEFSLDAAAKIPAFEFPDDQGWIDVMIPRAAGWEAGPRSGVYSFKKTSWPPGDDLPKDARMVVFPGWRSPEKFKHLPWVKTHWAA